MKFIKLLLLVFILTIFWSSLLFSQAVAANPFLIGVIDDCNATRQTNVFEEIKNEILSLTRGEFDVKFPKKIHIVSDCSEKGIKKGIDSLLSNPEVDMILALGPLSSHLLGQKKTYLKPCIAGLILNPELQSIPLQKGTSGRHNLTYVAMAPDLKSNVDLFKEIVPFKKAAFLYDNSLSESIESKPIFFKTLQQKIDTQLIFIPVGEDINLVLDHLDSTMEAVFIGDLVQLNSNGQSDLISYLNKNKIASFSFHDRELVEKGLLAGFDRSSENLRFSRRIAIMVQRILLKEDPKDFKVGFAREENLVINMQTAKKIEISPSFSLMAKAELINNDSLVAPLQKKRSGQVKTSTEELLLPSFVTGKPNEFNQESLALHETDNSLSLMEAVTQAIKNNLILKSKTKETAAGQMNVKEALSKFYPQLGTGLQGRVIDDDHTSAISGIAERSWAISAQASQLIYSDAAVTNLKISRHYQKAQELSENQERLDVILETAIAYLNTLKARANAGIQLENLKLVRSNLVLANNRYKAGVSGPSDVYRLESEAAISYSNLLDALAKISQSRIHLNQILNIELEKETILRDISLDDGLFIISDPDIRSRLKINNPKRFRYFRDFVVQKGLEQSPELAAIEEHIKVQTSVYDYAKRSYWSPNVGLNGNIGNTFSRSGDGSDFNPSSLPAALSPYFKEPADTSWTVSLNIEIPFYEGGAKAANKIRAFETRNQLKFQKYHIQNQIAENIRTALVEISASYPSIELTKISAVAAKKNLDLVQDAYSQGAVSIVNFLDAQNAALTANTFAQNAVYDFFMDFVLSERAAGQYSIFMGQEERKKWLQDFQK